MHVGFAAARLVQPFHRGGADDPHGDVLRDGCFAVAVGGGARADVVFDGRFWAVGVEVGVGVVEVVGLGAGAGEATGAENVGGAGEGVGDDCKGEEGDVVFFCEAQGGGCGADGGAEGFVEGGEREFEVDCVVGGGGLDGVGLEDCVLGFGSERGSRMGWAPLAPQAYYGEDPSWLLAGVSSVCEQCDLRPYLRALLRDDRKADLVIVEAHPGDLVQGRE